MWNGLYGFENAGNPFWYLRFYLTDENGAKKKQNRKTERFKERKYWTEWTEHIQSLVQIKRKAALTFNGNWVSMYDPIKIDPYLLLQKKKRKKRKILHNSVWKSCVFYDYFIPFHTMYTHSLYLVFSFFYRTVEYFGVAYTMYILNEQEPKNEILVNMRKLYFSL